ncbi:MAG: GSU2403 family nucleotidyltransferase fold protein [Burkholderiales bacterium]
MPTARPYARHDAAGQAKYQEVKQLARAQARVLSGTPGTLKRRTQSGRQYWVREHIRADGRKVDEYLGAEAAVDRERLETLRAEIDLAKALASGSGKLRLFGYQRLDRKPAAVLEVFFNRGLIQAGLTLVGSHAYGVLLNELGVLAPGYRTQDIDVARARTLAIALPDDVSFQQLLRETGLPFVPVPGMPSRKPSASFKLRGAEALAVDLLVPGRNVGEILPVKELNAFAQAIPLLEFLIAEPIDAVVLSPNQVIPVRVPAPERFALHKLFSSQSRRTGRDKVRKDLEQAALLSAVIEEETPGRIGDTFRRVPAESKAAVKRGAAAAARLLHGIRPQAEALLLAIAGK